MACCRYYSFRLLGEYASGAGERREMRAGEGGGSMNVERAKGEDGWNLLQAPAVTAFLCRIVRVDAHTPPRPWRPALFCCPCSLQTPQAKGPKPTPQATPLMPPRLILAGACTSPSSPSVRPAHTGSIPPSPVFRGVGAFRLPLHCEHCELPPFVRAPLTARIDVRSSPFVRQLCVQQSAYEAPRLLYA